MKNNLEDSAFNTFNNALATTLTSKKYREASEKVKGLKEELGSSNIFILPSLIKKISDFFFELRVHAPLVYEFLSINEIEFLELITRKRSGHKIKIG